MVLGPLLRRLLILSYWVVSILKFNTISKISMATPLFYYIFEIYVYYTIEIYVMLRLRVIDHWIKGHSNVNKKFIYFLCHKDYNIGYVFTNILAYENFEEPKDNGTNSWQQNKILNIRGNIFPEIMNKNICCCFLIIQKENIKDP